MSKGSCGNYLRYLIGKGLVERVDDGVYGITSKGINMLRNYDVWMKYVNNVLEKWIVPEIPGFDAFIMEFSIEPPVDINKLTKDLEDMGWLGEGSGFKDLGTVDESDYYDRVGSEMLSSGWSRLHYVIDGNHYFNIFDPPGYNVIVRVDGDGNGLGIASAVLKPHNFVSVYEAPGGHVLVRLALAYGLYYVHVLDALLRVNHGSRLSLNSSIIIHTETVNNEWRPLVMYRAYPKGLYLENLVVEFIRVPSHAPPGASESIEDSEKA